MAYDLNFWGEPDWARESGISPLFLMAVVVCLFGLAGAASASWAYHVRLSRQSELGELTRRCEKIAPEALAAKDHRRKAALWDKALMGLDERARAGMPWSAYLEELRRQVPDDIRFDTLAIRMEETVERGEGSGRGTTRR